jgi:hypothetical protein
VLLVSRPEGELDLGLREREVHSLAVVLDLEHVDSFGCQQREQAGEGARAIADPCADDEETPRLGEPVTHDLHEHSGIDVAAGEEGASRPGTFDLPAEKGCDRCGAGALDNELHPFEEEDDRCGDLVVGDSHDGVEPVGEDPSRQLGGLLDCDSVRDRGAEVGRAGEGSAALGLHADDADSRTQLCKRERDARGEPSTAHGEDNRLHLGQLLVELEPDRPLAGDDPLVVEGMNGGGASLHPLERRRLRLVEALACEHDLGAVASRRVHLRHRRLGRHEDRGVDSGLTRRPRDGLPVVAGARRDDACRALGCRQARDRRHGAPDLERAGPLQVLGLEKHTAAGSPAQGLGRRHGSLPSNAREELAGGPDVSEARTRPRRHRPPGRPSP